MRRALLSTVALTGLLAATLSATPAAADEATQPVSEARGLIVGSAPAVDVADAVAAAGVAADTSPLNTTTDVITFEEPLTEAEVAELAADLADQPGVAWVEPDLPVQPARDPFFPTDPDFSRQWNLWDSAAALGGYSVRGPSLWGQTIGSPDVVVAVIDTGVAAHPDLQTIPGYDFVSDVGMANDGDGWDADPSDPGDWVTQAVIDSGVLPLWCDARYITNSSWHGTHVAGIIGATQGNGIGISGAAPGVRVMTVRAMGRCGGYTSDIAAAITWASGGAVRGVPVNPTPAKVINLSLGGAAPCGPAFQSAIDQARARGVTVVAAAGNSNRPVSTFVPGNCVGVVSVAATDRSGQRASYSNYGTSDLAVTVAAPGGGAGGRVLSTANSGTSVPTRPNYVAYQGTSMAAPHVAAAAALAYSAGYSNPDAVAAHLLARVQPFPATGGCSITACGAGVLDLASLSPFAGIYLDGERTRIGGRKAVRVEGVSGALTPGAKVTPYVQLPGQRGYTAGTGVQVISADGSFTWQRRTGKKVAVYFRADDGTRSTRLVIR